MAPVLGFGLIAIAMVVTIDGMIAEHKQRKAETGAAIVSGFVGIAFFVLLLYAAGLI